ncbi:hypothetical protein ETAR_14070 [Edwardsiella tarda]
MIIPHRGELKALTKGAADSERVKSNDNKAKPKPVAEYLPRPGVYAEIKIYKLVT